MTDLATLDARDLVTARGGVAMKTRRGHGAYHSFDDSSLAMTDSGLRALGLTRGEVRSTHPWVNIKLRGGRTLQRRIDDRAPERDRRADLYLPRGFNRSPGDHADVSLR